MMEPQPIDLPSVDPLGTKRKLHPPFAFTVTTPHREELKPYLAVAEPFLTLPRHLVPSLQVAFKPPTMRYGWRAPLDFLLEYARKNRIRRKWGRNLSDYEKMSFALSALDKKCGSGMSSHHLRLRLTLIGWSERRTLIISMYTNYDLEKASSLPSEEEVERLQKALGMQEPPAWFLDNEAWKWTPW